MIKAFVLSLMWAPVAVTLACWLSSAIVGARSHREAIVRVLVEKKARTASRGQR